MLHQISTLWGRVNTFNSYSTCFRVVCSFSFISNVEQQGSIFWANNFRCQQNEKDISWTQKLLGSRPLNKPIHFRGSAASLKRSEHVFLFFLSFPFVLFFGCFFKTVFCQAWWHTPFIPALGRQRQVDLWEFKASLIYTATPRTARAIQRGPVSKTNQPTQQTNKSCYIH